MDGLWQDLRFGFRNLLRTPRITLAALACAAIGIGAAIFIAALTEALLLRQLPFADADRLVRIWLTTDGNATREDLSYPDVRSLREATRSFAAIEVTARTRAAVRTETGSERMRGESVSAGYFGTVGVTASVGRLFAANEYDPGAAPVVLISDAMWRRKFGGRPEVIGATLAMRPSVGDDAERLYTIVGVMPPGFSGTIDSDVSDFWLPIGQFLPQPLLESRTARIVWVLARLAPGATEATARAELAMIRQDLAAHYPLEYRHRAFSLEAVGEMTRERFRTGLLMLNGAAALLLLIACGNVANLLLARLAQREGELALRLALGAERKRVLRLLLTESLLLATAGGVLGTALAALSVRVFVARDVLAVPDYMRITLDVRMIALAAGVVAVTSILFGVLPAWAGSRVHPASRLRESDRSGTTTFRQRMLVEGLITTQVALAFVLAVGSTLMLRTYVNLLDDDVGFRTRNLLRMAVTLDPGEYGTSEAQLGFARDATTLLESQPGVRRVSFMAGVLPPGFDRQTALAVGGETVESLGEVPVHAVDDAFLDVLDIPLLRGRNLEPRDDANAPRVALVSESLAEALAPDQGAGAIGRRFQTIAADGRISEPMEIVGVVGDVKYHGPLTVTRGYNVYVPITQDPWWIMSIAIWTDVPPASLIEPLQRELGQFAPTSPQHWISTMEDELALHYGEARIHAWLTAVFGAAAALLVVLGLYGVLTYAVARRNRELAVRIAMGALPRDIMALVLGYGSRTMTLGLIAGALAAFAGARLVGSLVYGVAPTDVLTFILVGATLFLLGMVASYLPARRAAGVEPAETLRR